MSASPRRTESCAFCHATRDRVKHLIRGKSGKCICDTCAAFAATSLARVVHCTYCGAPGGRCRDACPSLDTGAA